MPKVAITLTLSLRWLCSRVSTQLYLVPVAPSTESWEAPVSFPMGSSYHKSIWCLKNRKICTARHRLAEIWTMPTTTNSHLHMGSPWLWLEINNMHNRQLIQTQIITISKNSWRIEIRGRVSSRRSLPKSRGYRILKSFWWCSLASKIPLSYPLIQVAAVVWSLNSLELPSKLLLRRKRLSLRFQTTKMKWWQIIPLTRLSRWLQS